MTSNSVVLYYTTRFSASEHTQYYFFFGKRYILYLRLPNLTFPFPPHNTYLHVSHSSSFYSRISSQHSWVFPTLSLSCSNTVKNMNCVLVCDIQHYSCTQFFAPQNIDDFFTFVAIGNTITAGGRLQMPFSQRLIYVRLAIESSTSQYFTTEAVIHNINFLFLGVLHA